jgi:hypothetical protein
MPMLGGANGAVGDGQGSGDAMNGLFFGFDGNGGYAREPIQRPLVSESS